jgi:hypothetical protein
MDENVGAYHEAGHMVAAWELGLTVTGATIVPEPDEGYAGRVLIPVEERVRYADWVDEDGYLYAFLVTHYAGIAASEIYTGAPMSDVEIELALGSYGSDYYIIGDFILAIAGPEEADQVQLDERAQRHAKFLMGTRWERVREVAGVLLERETLDEGECRQVLEEVRR